MKKLDFVVLAAWFYLGWFGCILLARGEHSALSLAFPGLVFVFLIIRQLLTFQNMVWTGVISGIGVLLDAMMIRFGYIAAVGQSSFFIPIWLVALWILFAISMIKLGSHWKVPVWLSSLLGFFMGPLSYKSGEVFQVLSFTTSSTATIYAVFWAVMFPLVLFLSKRFT